MRLSIKTRQIIAVTAIVFTAVAVMGVLYLLSIAGILLQETRTRADMLTSGVASRAIMLAAEGGDLRDALARDSGVRSLLQLSGMTPHVMYVAVGGSRGRIGFSFKQLHSPAQSFI